MKPLLLLDIDGPLNPWQAKQHRRPEGCSTYRMNPLDQHGTPWTRLHRKRLRVWLKDAHGPQIMALGKYFELVWASTWGPEANTWIGPAIGLPELKYVDFWAENKNPEKPERTNGVYWKVPHLLSYAAGRPFVWVDDEVTQVDREYIAANHPEPALAHHVNPRLGLLDEDFTMLAAWVVEL